MAPISKKVGSVPVGKTGGNLISKSPTGKSNSAMKFGSKQNNSGSSPVKTSSSSFGDKKSTSSNFGGNKASTSSFNSGKTSSSNFSSTNSFGNKTGGVQNNDGKRHTTSNFGELATSSKTSKISTDPLKTLTDKSYASSYVSPKNRKSSIKFGIIWLPTRKRNKMRDTVYNPYDTNRRDLFKERTPSMYNFMSGDTSDRQTFKKKDEETDLLVSERTKLPIVSSDELSTDIAKTGNSEEKQEFLKQNSSESKEAGGDSHEKDDTNDYLENKRSLNKPHDATWEKDKSGDNVDSVYLRSPPAHKARSSVSTVEDDDCGIKCLYYTLQCCDCVLM